MIKLPSKQDVHAWQWLGFAVIAFFVLIAYAPSLMHGPRADQIMYLAEMAHKTSFWDLTAGAVDLNRHRHFNPGDEALFRPVVYIALGLQKYFFGYNFVLWQGLGIALHLTVVWCLLRLLLAISCGWVAIAATAFFALMFTNMEMVIWHHITAYMVFIISLLAALRHTYLILDGKGTQKNYIWAFGWLLLGAFTHEMTTIAALAIGVTVWVLRPVERRSALLFLAVPWVYFGTSLLNALMHPFTVAPQTITGGGSPIGNWFYAMGTWLYTGLFPSQLQWLLAARNMIAPEEVHLIKPLQASLPVVLALAAVLVYGLCWWLQRQKEQYHQARVVTALLALSLGLCFAALIAVGRGAQVAMWDILRVNTYYMYIWWGFMTVALFAIIDWSSVGAWPKRILAFVLAGLIIFNAVKLYQANEFQSEVNNSITVLVRTIELLIKEHGQEKGFSFYVDPKYPGNYIYRQLRRKDDPLNRQYNFIEALYPQYFTTENPKYKFSVRPFLDKS